MEIDKLMDIAGLVIDKAKARGIEMAEAYISSNRELNIDVRNKKVDTLKLSENIGLGMRVLVDGKIGFSFTSDMSQKALKENMEKALENAKITHSDPCRDMIFPYNNYPKLEQYDSSIQKISIEEKIAMARKIEEDALALDSRIKVIEGSSYTDGEEEIALVNTKGLTLSGRSSYFGISLSLVAEEKGENQAGFFFDYTPFYQSLNPQRVAKKAVKKATEMFGAKSIAGGKMPVILDAYIAKGFLELLANSFSAEAVQKGKSLFKDRLGEKVVSPLINLIDDGTLEGGLASFSFDGEGVPMQRTVLVNNGVLESFLYNIYTAKKDKTVSTGNGFRGSFKSTPEVGATNFFLEPGNNTLVEMIEGLSKGLYITEVMGLHTANPISGDFSLGASGFLIEKGKIITPVRGIAIAGNILDLFNGVEALGNDLRFFGFKGACSVLINQISVSGE